MHEKKKHRRFYRAWQLGVQQTPQQSKEEECVKEEKIRLGRECGKRLQNILNAKVTILVMPSEDTGKQNKTKHKVLPTAQNKEPGKDRRVWGRRTWFQIWNSRCQKEIHMNVLFSSGPTLIIITIRKA